MVASPLHDSHRLRSARQERARTTRLVRSLPRSARYRVEGRAPQSVRSPGHDLTSLGAGREAASARSPCASRTSCAREDPTPTERSNEGRGTAKQRALPAFIISYIILHSSSSFLHIIYHLSLPIPCALCPLPTEPAQRATCRWELCNPALFVYIPTKSRPPSVHV